jgi:hypothetical protein
MAAEPATGFRRFLQTPLGKAGFVLLSVGVVFATYTYVTAVLAIPVFLIVGLALPIYGGLKRPRFLALSALVVLLVVAPLATVVYSQEVLTPPGSASSPGSGPFESGGSVLQNAYISPFTGSASTSFTWNVTLYPKYLNSSLESTNWSNDSLELFVSTCPGATQPNLSYCGGGYSLIVVDPETSLSKLHPPTNGSVESFQLQVPSSGIWSWQMILSIQNTSNATNPNKIELAGDPTYNGLEGPIVGGFGVVYGALILTVYEVEFVYLGILFYLILLLYMWFKSREARRKDALKRAARSMAGATPPAPAVSPGPGTGPTSPGAAPVASSSPSSELTCPHCGAIIYAHEAKCWKCGGPLDGSGPSASPPLASGGTGPGRSP